MHYKFLILIKIILLHGKILTILSRRKIYQIQKNSTIKFSNVKCLNCLNELLNPLYNKIYSCSFRYVCNSKKTKYLQNEIIKQEKIQLGRIPFSRYLGRKIYYWRRITKWNKFSNLPYQCIVYTDKIMQIISSLILHPKI